MKAKKEIPLWAVVSSIAAALALVVALFAKGGSLGDPSADEIVKARTAQSAQASRALSGASNQP